MARMTGQQASSRLPTRTSDRRPALAALAILLVMLGALGSALIAYRSGDRVEVLVASRDISPGTQVTIEDFTVARVAHDGGQTVSASSIQQFNGAYATSRIPAGTIVINTMFSEVDFVPAGGQLVGVSVAPELRPSQPIEQGDVVALYSVTQGSGEAPVAATLVPAVRVVQVSSSENSSTLDMTVLVPDAEVANVVALSASGLVAVTTLPDDVAPALDKTP